MKNFNFQEFVRECYLRSVPSIDLNEVTEKINSWDYKLNCSEYEKICEEFGVNEDADISLGCSMWMLNAGPSLVAD